MEGLAAGEIELVEAAVHGDTDAFRQLVEPLHRELHLLCYRMLGSYHDAEDVLQNAQFKAWQGLRGFDGRARFRTWMVRVTTNACLDALRTRRRRVLPQDIGAARNPALGLGDQRHDLPWLEPFPDSRLPGADPAAAAELRESVHLAFVWALQILPPRQRATLILRDVLDWSARGVAAALGTSVAAVNSSLQRARATLARRPAGADLASRRSGYGTGLDELAARYVRAWETGDMDAIVSMLAADAIHAMPPWPAWFAGRDSLRELYAQYPVWRGHPGPGVFRMVPTALNGGLAFAEYCRQQAEGPYHALALTVVTPDPSGTEIVEKISFVSADLLTRLGYPSVLE
ncbi:MAG: RNA polymerase subunit sigma-70 [Gemmatimonadales bacterium]